MTRSTARLPHSPRKGVLFVDDEQLAGKYFKARFAPRFPVHIASSARQALEILDQHYDDIGVVISDERMPECTGVKFLATVRAQHPHMVRILTTAYMETDTLLEAINVGSVFAFVNKPWQLDDLEQVLLNALQTHDRQVEDADLLAQKMAELRNQLMDNHVQEIGLIASKLGHYVYNALCPVTFLLDQLIDGEVSSQYPREFLEEVRANVQELVETLRDLERAGTLTAHSASEEINLRQALDEALKQTQAGRKERRLTVEADFEDNLPPIQGNKAEFEKLFRFMITEQLVSLPRDSVVKIRGRLQKGASGEGILLEFEDTVPVSPKVQVERLLLPFNLRGANPRELGVFLSCCYMIVRRHGGTFSANRRIDQGIVYSFFITYDPRSGDEVRSGLFQRMASDSPDDQ